MTQRKLVGGALVLLSLGLLLLHSGCGTSNTGGKQTGADGGNMSTIKIVSSLPRTGSAKAQTDTIVNGIKMALEEAGYKAGGFTITYEDLDDATTAAGKWTTEAEKANADRAAQDPSVMAYIGPYNSGAAEISMPILNRANLLMISPANTTPRLTKPGYGGDPNTFRPTGKINYFRVVPTDDLQAALSAGWAQELGVKSVYILDDNEVYGKGVAELFKEACLELNIKVLGKESIENKAQEFKTLMDKIKGLSPDLVYFGGTTQTKGGQIARDLANSGMKAKLMVPDGCYEDAFIEAAGADNVNDRCFVTFGGLPPQELLKGQGKGFVENYRKKHKADPEAYAIYGYEAARVVLAVINKAGKRDREAILDSARNIKDLEGSLGRWSFDKNGDTTLTTMSGVTVRNGKFAFVKALGK